MSAIFPYGAQIDKFQRENKELINKARKTFKSFEIDTVDAFQGRETDIVLVNTVVTDMSRGNFLNDFRRINVSMSRARDKLFIFGNPTTLSNIDMKVMKAPKELKRFEKVFLNPHERKTIIINVEKDCFEYFNVCYDSFYIDDGRYELTLATSSRNYLKTLTSFHH